MCLAMPGQVVDWQNAAERLATVDFGGVRRAISLMLVPEAEIGDWVIAHAGFALTLLAEDEAASSLQAHRDLEQLP